LGQPWNFLMDLMEKDLCLITQTQIELVVVEKAFLSKILTNEISK